MKHKFISHTADIKFRAYGRSLEEVFSNSAYALVKFLVSGKIKEVKKKKIKVSGRDLQSLMYNFLEEILFLIDSENFFVSKILKIKIDKRNFALSCEVLGDSGENYNVESHIKAVTYNEMFVRKSRGKWVAQVVLDI